MSKGEFDSPSKAPSEAYRDNWERIWGGLWREAIAGPMLDPAFEPEVSTHRPFEQLQTYLNGCPVLPEGM